MVDFNPSATDSLKQTALDAKEKMLQSSQIYEIEKEAYFNAWEAYQKASRDLMFAQGPDKAKFQKKLDLSKATLFPAETRMSIAADRKLSDNRFYGKISYLEFVKFV